VSSLMDTWLMLSNLEVAGERSRAVQIVKSRGMSHSNQVRRFVMGPDGVQVAEPHPREDTTVGSSRPRSVILARGGSARRGRSAGKVSP
jgi:circadian clock protein KaiC